MIRRPECAGRMHWFGPCSGPDCAYCAHVAATVDAAPPLTQGQKATLRLLLRPAFGVVEVAGPDRRAA